MKYLENKLAEEVLEVCKIRDWSLKWADRGVNLHLEASELIEALRGKEGIILEEAADVLFVLMSITESNNIPFNKVFEQLHRKTEELKTKPRYLREEYEKTNK